MFEVSLDYDRHKIRPNFQRLLESVFEALERGNGVGAICECQSDDMKDATRVLQHVIFILFF